jgi:acyl carrier protein
MKDVLATIPDDADQDLIESGLLDSMALIELLYAIEQEFTIELPLEDLDVERAYDQSGASLRTSTSRGPIDGILPAEMRPH